MLNNKNIKSFFLSLILNFVILLFIPFLSKISLNKKYENKIIKVNKVDDFIYRQPLKKEKYKDEIKKNILVNKHKNIKLPLKQVKLKTSPIILDELKNVSNIKLDWLPNLNAQSFDAEKKIDINLKVKNKSFQNKFKLKPIYPFSAKQMGIEGFVIVSFTIDINGKTKNIKILKAKPNNVFNNSAINAIKQWEFYPEIKDGKKVEVESQIRINYNLEDE